jgi:hypothetical protein
LPESHPGAPPPDPEVEEPVVAGVEPPVPALAPPVPALEPPVPAVAPPVPLAAADPPVAPVDVPVVVSVPLPPHATRSKGISVIAGARTAIDFMSALRPSSARAAGGRPVISATLATR